MRDLFGASAAFRMDFSDGDEIRPDHDVETCDCCGEQKTTIINFSFDFFTTEDGDVYTEPTDDTVWNADATVRNDGFTVLVEKAPSSTSEPFPWRAT